MNLQGKEKELAIITRFLYDLPAQLNQLILAVRRHFDSEVIKEVTPAFQELVDEGVICEAGDCIKLVSNLLPVSKPTAEYALSSKIDKKLQISERRGLNRSRLTLDVRSLNCFLAPAPPLPLQKIAELKNHMQDKLFSVLDLAMMFYSIKLTERSKGFLCFYALEENKIYTFQRLVMGLKSAPYIASRSM